MAALVRDLVHRYHRERSRAVTGATPLDRLSDLAGLVPAYRDALGNNRQMMEGTQRALLAAMGIDASGDDAIAAAIRDFEEAPWRAPLAPVHVAPHARGTHLRVPLTLSTGNDAATLAWRLERETGAPHNGSARLSDLPLIARRRLDGHELERRWLEIPMPIGPGYHRLQAFSPALGGLYGQRDDAALPLIIVPKRCHPLASGREGARPWGIGIQLYGLRSARNWGAGDFTDLARFLEIAARLGADTVGLNPLHALFPRTPERISPYSPSDRRFFNMLYIDVEAVPDFETCDAVKALMGSAGFRDRLAAARQSALVDHPAVIALKREALELLFQTFRERHLGADPDGATTERGHAFRRFQREGGQALERLGIFQALDEHFPAHATWMDWPDPYRDCESAAVAAFAAARSDRVAFYQYLQWLAFLQLQGATEAARETGMAIGLYHDLALAADRAGAESWVNRRCIARGVSLGAPPDAWNHRGQDWGLPAYNPHALRAAAYAPFADVLRANMAHGGALRVDHVMGLERAYWIPRGADPRDGGYVRSPVADLIGILALESRRQRCAVIGEDLGTLPDGFQDRTRATGILSYRLLYFARTDRGAYLPPSRYPAQSLVAIGTHDLPTLPGFWNRRDLELRTTLGLYPSPEIADAAHAGRDRECAALIRAFKRHGLLPASFPEAPAAFSFDIVQAAYRYIARSPARLLLLHLEDVLGEENQINLPGTVAEYPNWRQRVPLDLAALDRDPRLADLARAIGAERRRKRRSRRTPEIG